MMAEHQSTSSTSHLAPPPMPLSRSAERPRSSSSGLQPVRPGTAGSAWSTPSMREHSPNPGIGVVGLQRGDLHEAASSHSGSTAMHRSGDRIGTPNSVKSRVCKIVRSKDD